MSTETTNDLRHGFTVIRGNEKTVIKLRLNDECGNGHEDFSLTADIYEKNGRGQWREAGGGCCHEHILKLKPGLAPFAMLHLCTWEGTPMYSAANAWYWLQGVKPEFADHSPNLGACHGGSGAHGKSPDECRRIFAEHIHATDEQVAEIISRAPRSEIELRAVLEDLGFPEQWKSEADAAIAMLEQWTGKKFESKATRGQWQRVSPEQRAEIEQRRASGYYEPEQVAARDAEKASADKAKCIAEIEREFCAKVEKLERQKLVELYFVTRYFPNVKNFIYYSHSNEIGFNWSSSEKLITRAEFDAIEAELDRSGLPEGVTLKWQASAKF